MAGVDFVVCDIETNGLCCKGYYHEVCEISMVRASDRHQLSRQIIVERPENSSFDALKITGKTMSDLKEGVSRNEAVEEFSQFLTNINPNPNGICVIGHNIISFDKKFLFALWEKVGERFPASLWLDTVALTGQFIKQSDITTLNITKTATGKISKTLHASCDLLGVKKISTAHNARDDARNNYMLWKALVDQHNIDYLPHIKSFPHIVEGDAEIDFDMSDLEMTDDLA